MSDQRRTVESETPRCRAASEVVRPSRLVCAVLVMGRTLQRRRRLQGGPTAFAQVSAPLGADPPASGSIRAEMGALDQLDLDRKLKRRHQDERLAAGGRRLSQLRLALGGKL